MVVISGDGVGADEQRGAEPAAGEERGRRDRQVGGGRAARSAGDHRRAGPISSSTRSIRPSASSSIAWTDGPSTCSAWSSVVPEWDDSWAHTRGSVIQRVFSHDVYHCAELNETLGIAGLLQIDLWD